VKYVPRGKAIWNANGGFVSVLLTHLLLLLLHHLIDHKRLHNWSAVVGMALSCTIFELCNVDEYRDLERSLKVIGSG